MSSGLINPHPWWMIYTKFDSTKNKNMAFPPSTSPAAFNGCRGTCANGLRHGLAGGIHLRDALGELLWLGVEVLKNGGKMADLHNPQLSLILQKIRLRGSSFETLPSPFLSKLYHSSWSCCSVLGWRNGEQKGCFQGENHGTSYYKSIGFTGTLSN